MAKRFATVIDSTVTAQSSVCHCPIIGPKTFISTVISTNAAEPFDTTDR